MAGFRKLLATVRRELYERLDNDAKSFRYETEEEDMIRTKIKYLNRHLRDEIVNGKSKKDQISCYGYLGLAYIKLDDYTKAREYFDIQLEMATEYNDDHMCRMAYANLGESVFVLIL